MLAGSLPLGTIQRHVAEHYDIGVEELLSDRRAAAVTHPRLVAYYLCRELTPASLPQIGRAFHRDHTTILSGISAIERLMRMDSIFAREVLALKAELRRAVGKNRIAC